MCGIAGIFHLETAKPVDPQRIGRMADALAHRGPDGEGVWTAAGVGLGHRRLSIIDLAGGAQPMADAEGRFTIVFNGEIYNYREVRAELESLGHAFRTAGDTETILAGFRQWGSGVLFRLNGMFAVAIHDAREQSLFLARDRLGVKPLHYCALADGSIAFASELKGLLANPAVRREPDPRAIEDYLCWGYVPDDACILSGVRKLPAGSLLRLQRGKPLPQPERWWDVDFSRRARGSAADLEEELRHHVRAAVASRMVSDVPVGAFLSGGVDSSTVVAFMAEASRTPVETCAIGFDDTGLDETRFARMVAERFATRHRSRIVAWDDFAAIDTLVAAFDEPFADASALPTWRVCQLARETVTVALSGDGADEAFAGYRRHRFHLLEERMRAIVPERIRQPLFGFLGRHYPKADWAPRPLRARSTFAALSVDGAEAYARAVAVTGADARERLFSASFRHSLQGHRGEDRWIATMKAAPARTGLDAAQYADLKIWLPGDILTKVDRTSMAVSLEAREPLLDHRLVEFAATLPDALRIRRGEGKWLLKKAMRGHLPDDVLHRPKMGFVTPVSAWFRGPLAGVAAALPDSPLVAETGWFEREAVSAVISAHRTGLSDNGRLIWELVMLDRAMNRLFA
jgi:asparagine synthase (glutamine-hydrolysing)